MVQMGCLSTKFENSSDLDFDGIPARERERTTHWIDRRESSTDLLYFCCRTPKQFDVSCSHDFLVFEQSLCCIVFRFHHDECIACTSSIGIMYKQHTLFSVDGIGWRVATCEELDLRRNRSLANCPVLFAPIESKNDRQETVSCFVSRRRSRLFPGGHTKPSRTIDEHKMTPDYIEPNS